MVEVSHHVNDRVLGWYSDWIYDQYRARTNLSSREFAAALRNAPGVVVISTPKRPSLFVFETPLDGPAPPAAAYATLTSRRKVATAPEAAAPDATAGAAGVADAAGVAGYVRDAGDEEGSTSDGTLELTVAAAHGSRIMNTVAASNAATGAADPAISTEAALTGSAAAPGDQASKMAVRLATTRLQQISSKLKQYPARQTHTDTYGGGGARRAGQRGWPRPRLT